MTFMSDLSPEDWEGLQQLAGGDSTPVPADDTPMPVPPVAPAQPYQVASAGANIPPPPPTSYFQNTAGYESGNNPNARNPASTAGGRYQILDGTLQDVLRLHPEIPPNADKNDPRVMSALTSDNASFLRNALGHQPSALELHAAHFLGATGAVRFLRSDPNTPVDQVVSPDALAANRNVFFDKSGSPYTVGQVYAAAARQFGGDPNMPQQDTAQAQWQPQQDHPASSPAAHAAVAQAFDPNNPFAQQGKDIQSYIASQPAMWAKLQQMQQAYLSQSKPTLADRFGDSLSGIQMMQAAADANRHASAGGVLNHELPDAAPFQAGIKAAHDMDIAQRQRNDLQAKTAYELGSGALAAQNTAGQQNLGLTGSLAKEQADYGLASQKYGLELAQFGQKNAELLTKYAEEMIPNPETRARVMQEFQQSGNPSGSLAANQKIINDIASKHQASGEQISAREPAQMYQASWTDPVTHEARYETVNLATPEGQKRQTELQQQFGGAGGGIDFKSLGATQVNVGTGSEGGGGGGQAIDEQHRNAMKTSLAADTVLKLLPYLNEHGGTGIITDSSIGKDVLSGLNQIGIPVGGLTVRQVFSKLVNQVGTGLVLPSLKEFGARPAQTEFQQLLKGQLGETAPIEAIKSYMQYVKDSADYDRQKLRAEGIESQKQKNAKNTSWSRENWSMDYDESHPQPSFNADDLIEQANKQAGQKSSPSEMTGQASSSLPHTTTPQGDVIHNFYNWGKNQLLNAGRSYGIVPPPAHLRPSDYPNESTPAPPTSPSAPAAPSEPRMPTTPEEERFLRGGR